jgi:hypothetical protein
MTQSQPLTALIMALNQMLLSASHLAKMALEAAEGGNQNAAIGALLPIERDIEASQALFKTAVLLHRLRNVGKGGAQ